VKSVENVHGVSASGEVNHTIGAARFQNANLFNTLADGRQWLEIVRLTASLDLIKLVTCIVTRALGKVSQALERIAKEAHRPHSSSISDWI
jgi:hypothetical protein